MAPCSQVVDRGLTLAVSAFLLLLVVVAYHGAPRNAFHLDDRDSIVERASVHIEHLSPAALLAAGRDAALSSRPLPSVTFAIDWWRGGGAPQAFLQTNVLLHVINVLLVFALLRQVLAGAAPGRAVLFAAAAGAALFAVHPLQSQAVTYVVQRMAELATLFVLLSTGCWLRGLRARRFRVAWFAAAGGAFLLGAASKEIAWITPLLWVLASRIDAPGVGGRVTAMIPALLALALFLDIGLGGPLWEHFAPGYGNRPFTPWERLLTEPRVLLYHVGQLLWPLPGRFSLEHDVVLSSGLLVPPSTLPALLAVVAWSVLGYVAWLRGPHRLGLFMLWLPATLAVESTLVPLELLFEHRFYLPMFGFSGLFALGVLRLQTCAANARRVGMALLAVALAGCAYATAVRVADWATPIGLLQSALPHAPRSARLHANIASLLHAEGRHAEALAAARRALALEPGQPVALEVLAFDDLDRGLPARARKRVEHALERGGATHHLRNLQGEIALAERRVTDAVAAFTAAAALAPWRAEYRWNLALALEAAGRCADAAVAWRAYLDLERDTVERTRATARLGADGSPPDCG